MAVDTRSDRTARRLALRLEELAHTVERSELRNTETNRLIELAAVATMHAVTLELLTSQRASEIWSDASARHPALARARRL